MKNKKEVFISAYCQNSYQEGRIKNFVKGQNLEIINSSFNTKVKKKNVHALEKTIGKISLKEENLIYNSDEIWILIGSLDSNLSENKIKMYGVEKYSRNLNKPLKYFYLYQSGSCVGKAKPLDRKEIFNSVFYKSLHKEEYFNE